MDPAAEDSDPLVGDLALAAQLGQLSLDQGRVAHIHKLPPELLLPIFECCAEDAKKDPETQTSLHADRGPWLIAKICRRWRQIILSSGHFWSDIRVRTISTPTTGDQLECPAGFDDCDEDELPPTLYLLSTQLFRSRDCPLTIYVDSSKWTQCPDYERLVGMLFHHHNRWKMLEIQDQSGIFHGFLRMWQVPVDCPILERVISYVIPESSHPEPEFDQTFDNILSHDECHSLTSAKFRASYPPSWGLPWRQIEELQLNEVAYLEYFIPNYWFELTNLTFLKLVDCDFEEVPPESYFLPNLVALYTRRTPSIFPWITAPSLETIQIDIIHDQEIAECHALLARSQCCIRVFRCTLHAVMDLFLPLLQEMDALEDLKLHLPSHKEIPGVSCVDLSNALQLIEGDSFQYCPQLHSLNISWRATEDEDLSVIFDLVERRTALDKGGQRQIQNLELTRKGKVPMPELMERISALEKGGMGVTIRGPHW